MRRKSLLFVLIAVFLVPAFALQESQSSFDGKTWWEHVKVLAADNMEGRDTGSSALREAEAYAVKSTSRQEGFFPASEVRIAATGGKGVKCCSDSQRQG